MLNTAKIILRVCALMHITLTEEVTKELGECKVNEKFLFVDGDIEQLDIRTKKMNIGPLAAGIALSLQAAHFAGGVKKAQRLYKLAYHNFQIASEGSLGYLRTYKHWAEALTTQANNVPPRERAGLLREAATKYEVS